MLSRLTFYITRNGLVEISEKINEIVVKSNVQEGICIVCLEHTTAGLIITENFHRSSLDDLNKWLAKLVSDYKPNFTHSPEEPEDIIAHVKTAMSKTDICIPILDGQLGLGPWQGVFLWNHSKESQPRHLSVYVSE